MNRIRTWVGGLGISAPCVIIALAMTPGLDLTSSGPVHGRVTYNGRPLDGGYVVFEPAEGNPNEWAVGPIDQDGSYSIDSKWQRGNHERGRFRICVVPENGKPVADMPSPSEGAKAGVVPISLSSEKPDSRRSVAVDCQLPKRFTKVQTSGLHVTLGREPARVDIDLKDY
jgi:hypothetical protein